MEWILVAVIAVITIGVAIGDSLAAKYYKDKLDEIIRRLDRMDKD